MRRLTALIVMGVFAAAACSSSSGNSSPKANGTGSTATQAAAQSQANTNADCGAGSTTGTYKGKTTEIFCGPAAATVKIGTTTYTITGGDCLYDSTVGFGVNIGTSVLDVSDVPADGPQFFSVIALPGSSAVAMGFMGGHAFSVEDGSDSATVNVAADHQSGSASGSTTAGEAFTATFTC